MELILQCDGCPGRCDTAASQALYAATMVASLRCHVLQSWAHNAAQITLQYLVARAADTPSLFSPLVINQFDIEIFQRPSTDIISHISNQAVLKTPVKQILQYVFRYLKKN